MSSLLDEKQVERAVRALLAYLAKAKASGSGDGSDDDKKSSLFEDDTTGRGGHADIDLIFALKKIADKGSNKPIRISIPHTLYGITGREICLITKDPADDYKSALDANPVEGVTKVIGLTTLKKNYKPFNEKRKLLAAYDLFLADERVLPLLPPILGKKFFEKKKYVPATAAAGSSGGGEFGFGVRIPSIHSFAYYNEHSEGKRNPVPVNLAVKNFRDDLAAARDATYLFISSGPCCLVKAAKSSFSVPEIVANIVAAVNGSVESIARKWKNIQSIHIKTSSSAALPIFNSLPLAAKLGGAAGDDTAAATATATAAGTATATKSAKAKAGKKGGKPAKAAPAAAATNSDSAPIASAAAVAAAAATAKAVAVAAKPKVAKAVKGQAITGGKPIPAPAKPAQLKKSAVAAGGAAKKKAAGIAPTAATAAGGVKPKPKVAHATTAGKPQAANGGAAKPKALPAKKVAAGGVAPKKAGAGAAGVKPKPKAKPALVAMDDD